MPLLVITRSRFLYMTGWPVGCLVEYAECEGTWATATEAEKEKNIRNTTTMYKYYV